ncbi:hypothetical protein ACRASX_12015 [Flavobacterium sp. TMP13]|uniref:hypothetical protein n=1 Tax=Flavobacterium sp. TMP13 TaxID=3425950 RepID=UPI003D77A659
MCFCLQYTSAKQQGQDALTRQNTFLNKNWKFHLGNATNPIKDFDYSIVRNFTIAAGVGGAVSPKFDDNKWRTVNVPHDWAVELPFEYHRHFDVQSRGLKTC